MVHDGTDWYVIAETLGRTIGACKSRYRTIQNDEHSFQSAPSSPETGSTSTEQKQPPWTSDDEMLLLELRALGRSYNDIAGFLSVQRTPHAIANHHLALTNRRHDLLIKHDEKKRESNPKAAKVIPTDYDHLEDIIQEMSKLGIQQTPDKKASVCCLHCHRPSGTSSSRQPLCLQCKTVQKAYTVNGLFECIEAIKKAPLAKKDRVPVGKDGLTYVWKHEYHKYLALDLSARTENEAKNTRPRVSCETLLKLALDNGLTDAYTNIDGHWSAKDDLWKLTFAYIVSETGQIKLEPVLAVIARLTECSTEEQIKDWVGALRTN